VKGVRVLLDIELLLRAYANGIFPMADARDDPETFWVEPKSRAILPLDGFKLSRSLAKNIRQDRFEVTTDKAFARVITLCADVTSDRNDTWINSDIEQAFLTLHAKGLAHSVECWLDGELVGGLYGLAQGRAFCGESMFSRATDASKVALAWLVARMKIGGFQLLDCQFMTDHLASLGVIEISQKHYLALLHDALAEPDQVSIVSSSTTGSSGSSTGSGARSGLALGAAWGALDGFLSAGLAGSSGAASAEEGAVDPVAGRGSGGASSSPGKLILQALTQTS
jgi:leucyl/phenylalanyl-tRNA--protein transferase